MAVYNKTQNSSLRFVEENGCHRKYITEKREENGHQITYDITLDATGSFMIAAKALDPDFGEVPLTDQELYDLSFEQGIQLTARPGNKLEIDLSAKPPQP